MTKKRVVLFGFYCPEQTAASRAIVLVGALGATGHTLEKCICNALFYRFWRSPVAKILAAMLVAPFRWLVLAVRYVLLIQDHDLVFVPAPSHMDAWLALLLGRLRNKPVLADAFYGLYDTIVRDRKLVKSDSLAAALLWRYERVLLRNLTVVLIDTDEHRDMLLADYALAPNRVVVIPVGIDERLWMPSPMPDGPEFRVVFWGTFIPLHGVETIGYAAKIVEEQRKPIRFVVIGSGQEDARFRRLLEDQRPANVEWINGFLSLAEVQRRVQNSHCCLGIFGAEKKTDRVLPFKAYQALAAARPLITARTRITERLFTDRKDAILVAPGEAHELAAAVIWLADHRAEAAAIGRNGRKLYEEKLSIRVIEERLSQVMEDLP
jgi:glycosyltransferase involved in cell wall biosynthesis